MDIAGLSVRGPYPRAVRSLDSASAAAATADQRQAEYFLRLLTELRSLGDHQTVPIEDRDRQVLDSMIENLRRRFSLVGRSGGSSPSRRARAAVR